MHSPEFNEILLLLPDNNCECETGKDSAYNRQHTHTKHCARRRRILTKHKEEYIYEFTQ